MKHRVYPVRLFQWIHKTQNEMTPDQALWVVGEDLIAAGWVKACEGHSGDVAEARKLAAEKSAGFVASTPLPVR